MSIKKRLDLSLVERGLTESREKARALIMSGAVFVNGERADKPGQAADERDEITVRGGALKYVSRGGLKLERALAAFDLDVRQKAAVDVGASTGGFTDCLLQNGARHVYAVDVGYGQLAWSLRCDARVTPIERTNIRYLDSSLIAEPLDLAVIDVSFISLKLVLPKVGELLKPGGQVVALIKPQFEAGREHVGKKGVVRDRLVHIAVITRCFAFFEELGFYPAGLVGSPIRGPEGNIEFLVLLGREDTGWRADIEGVVAAAHDEKG